MRPLSRTTRTASNAGLNHQENDMTLDVVNEKPGEPTTTNESDSSLEAENETMRRYNSTVHLKDEGGPTKEDDLLHTERANETMRRNGAAHLKVEDQLANEDDLLHTERANKTMGRNGAAHSKQGDSTNDANDFGTFIATFSAYIAEEDARLGDDQRDADDSLNKKNMTSAIRCRFAEPEGPSCFYMNTEQAKSLHDDVTTEAKGECMCKSCTHRAPIATTDMGEHLNTSEKATSTKKASVAQQQRLHIAETKGFQKFKTLAQECRDDGGDNRGCHVSAVAGGGDANSTRQFRDIDEFTAIMDTGCTKHMVSKHIRLMNERENSLWMTSSDGNRTLLDMEGDFELPTADPDGNLLDPLILNDCSQLKGSPLNLLSVSVLCEAGTTFHFEKQNSYFTYRG